MRKKIALSLPLLVLFLARAVFAQEVFNDVRQRMADRLTAVKTALALSDREAARRSFDEARRIWADEVKTMIVEGVKTNGQFQQYFERIGQIEENLASLDQELKAEDTRKVESLANAVIWGISHHPRGFGVPPPRYTVWDWAFGLGIGVGFCIFAVVSGLYLRRSYYRRYSRQTLESRKG
jgi:hypothetical protein